MRERQSFNHHTDLTASFKNNPNGIDGIPSTYHTPGKYHCASLKRICFSINVVLVKGFILIITPKICVIKKCPSLVTS